MDQYSEYNLFESHYKYAKVVLSEFIRINEILYVQEINVDESLKYWFKKT